MAASSWKKAPRPQIWRGRAAHASCRKIEGGLVWIDGIPYIVRCDPHMGLVLAAVTPESLERRSA